MNFVPFTTQLRPTSIEKEIFPKMAQDDNLFAFDLSGKQHLNLKYFQLSL